MPDVRSPIVPDRYSYSHPVSKDNFHLLVSTSSAPPYCKHPVIYLPSLGTSYMSTEKSRIQTSLLPWSNFRSNTAEVTSYQLLQKTA